MKYLNFKKGDYIILLFLVLLFLSSLIYPVRRFFADDETLIAVIKQENRVIDTIDLNKVNQAYEFTLYYGDNGEFYNIIQVEPQRIRVKEANCREQIDVRVGWLSKNGDIAVCLPHRLIIEIKGQQKTDVDIIAR